MNQVALADKEIKCSVCACFTVMATNSSFPFATTSQSGAASPPLIKFFPFFSIFFIPALGAFLTLMIAEVLAQCGLCVLVRVMSHGRRVRPG